MTINQNKQTRDKRFLFSKTDIAYQGSKTETIEHIPESELKTQFPDILLGKPFMDHAMEQLTDSSMFGALAIHIDGIGSETKIPISSNHHVRMNLANSIHRICENENGIWGFVDPDIFGCFFPDKNGSDSQTLALEIKQSFSAGGDGDTVTIGIAFFPTLHFDKKKIMDNARKSLYHAEFFGHDSMVEFDAVSLNISGDKLYDTGNIDEAVKEFQSALLVDPSNVNVHNSLGVCYGIQENYDKALEEFQKAIELDSNETMALYNAGFVKTLTGRPDEALNYFLKAEDKNENIFEVAFQTGRLYMEINKAEKGLEYLNNAARLKPDSALIFASLGGCYSALDNTEEAVSAYKTAIKLNPNDAASLSALGLLYNQRGENLEIATIFCRQSVDLAPENSLFRFHLGSLYFKENRLKKALTQFEKATALGYDCEKEIHQIQNNLNS